MPKIPKTLPSRPVFPAPLFSRAVQPARETWIAIWDVVQNASGGQNVYSQIIRDLLPMRRLARDAPLAKQALDQFVNLCAQNATEFLSPPVSVHKARSMIRETRRAHDLARPAVDAWLRDELAWRNIDPKQLKYPFPPPAEGEPSSAARRLWNAYVETEYDEESVRTEAAQALVDHARRVRADDQLVTLFACLAGDRFTEHDLDAAVEFHRHRIDRWLFDEDRREHQAYSAARVVPARSTRSQQRRSR